MPRLEGAIINFESAGISKERIPPFGIQISFLKMLLNYSVRFVVCLFNGFNDVEEMREALRRLCGKNIKGLI